MDPLDNEKGQALVEFMILLPIVLMFMWYLVHVNVAINKSIVAQQHARSQVFIKLFNHRSGPLASELAETDRSDYYIAVAATAVGGDNGSGRYPAPTELLGVGMQPRPNPNANDDPGEPAPNTLRQRVRVRTVMGICTHRKKGPSGKNTDFCAIENSQ